MMRPPRSSDSATIAKGNNHGLAGGNPNLRDPDASGAGDPLNMVCWALCLALVEIAAMSTWPDIYEPFRHIIRESRWRPVIPYRLGIVIGEHGGGLAAPAHYGERARRNFDDGVVVGLERREEKGIAYADE